MRLTRAATTTIDEVTRAFEAALTEADIERAKRLAGHLPVEQQLAIVDAALDARRRLRSLAPQCVSA